MHPWVCAVSSLSFVNCHLDISGVPQLERTREGAQFAAWIYFSWCFLQDALHLEVNLCVGFRLFGTFVLLVSIQHMTCQEWLLVGSVGDICWRHRHRVVVQRSSEGLSKLRATVHGRILRWNYFPQSCQGLYRSGTFSLEGTSSLFKFFFPYRWKSRQGIVRPVWPLCVTVPNISESKAVRRYGRPRHPL